VYINIETPVGYKLSETDAAVKQVEEKLVKYPEIDNFSTTIGASIIMSTFSGGLGGASNNASIMANLVDKKQRKLKSYELEEKLRAEFNDIPNAKVEIMSLRGGPSGSSAFQAEISGEDINKLQKIAQDLKPILESVPGTVNVAVSMKEASPQYTFKLDQAKLALNGLTAVQVGSILRTAIAGTKVTSILRNGDEISVMAQFDPNAIPDLGSLQNLQIINSYKQAVYLKDMAQINLDPSIEKITRVDQKRTVILSSDITAKTTANEVLANFQKKIANYKLDEGYAIKYGGVNETSAEAVQSIVAAMGLAVILIIVTMVVQFDSFIKALIVLMTVPLALIGVFIGLAISGIPLSFPGLIGILALFGIVVKNAIILIDKINLNRASGINFRDSIIDAAKSRFEAIFITSFCTIVGIIPITLSSTTWQALGASIIFGLSISSFFTLFMIPSLYATLIKTKIN